MNKAILMAAILVGCSAAEQPADQHTHDPVPVTAPAELVGNWCTTDNLCLRIDPSGYGADWLVYSWTSDACREGGFIQVDASGALQFGALNFGPGCYGRNSADRYTVAFSLDGAELIAQLSVAAQPLRLAEN